MRILLPQAHSPLVPPVPFPYASLGPPQGANHGRTMVAGMSAQDDRRKRLAEALRDNLKRRKAQDRGRRNSALEQGDKAPPAAQQPGVQE